MIKRTLFFGNKASLTTKNEQLVIKTETSQLGNNQLNTGDLTTGMYTMKLSNNRNIAYRKIIKN